MNTIEEVLEQFPFEKLQQHMTAIQHTWLIHERMVVEVPTVEDLKNEGRRLLFEVADSVRDNSSAKTGGLCADKFTWGTTREFRLRYEGPFHSSAYFKLEKESVEPEYIRLLMPAAAELRRTGKLLELVAIGATVTADHYQIAGCHNKADAIVKYLREQGYGEELKECGIS